MSQIAALDQLLAGLSPRIMPGAYVFACLTEQQVARADPSHRPLATFRETEGETWVIEQHIAEQERWQLAFECTWIQLDVQSALHAVGLTATVSNALAAQNISCNIVAAYHHDHLFVPRDQAALALFVLRQLQTNEPSNQGSAESSRPH